MPVWSKDVQYGAAIGFVIIVGIVAIQFGFSAKLVLALLAGVGILFCASQFDGLPRAAMLGAGAVLLLVVVYDLAASCDSACQQTRAEAARQRAAQEQARLAAEQARLAASRPPTDPLCDWSVKPIVLGPEWVELHGDRCTATLLYPKQDVELYVKVLGDDAPKGPYHAGEAFPNGAVAVMNKGKPISAGVQLSPSPNQAGVLATGR